MRAGRGRGIKKLEDTFMPLLLQPAMEKLLDGRQFPPYFSFFIKAQLQQYFCIVIVVAVVAKDAFIQTKAKPNDFKALDYVKKKGPKGPFFTEFVTKELCSTSITWIDYGQIFSHMLTR